VNPQSSGCPGLMLPSDRYSMTRELQSGTGQLEAAATMSSAVPNHAAWRAILQNLWMCFPVVAVALDDVLPWTIAVAVQGICECVCPDLTYPFIDVLPKVGDVEHSAPVVEMCICQVFSESFKHGYCNLPFVYIHSKLHCEQHCENGFPRQDQETKRNATG